MGAEPAVGPPWPRSRRAQLCQQPGTFPPGSPAAIGGDDGHGGLVDHVERRRDCGEVQVRAELLDPRAVAGLLDVFHAVPLLVIAGKSLLIIRAGRLTRAGMVPSRS